MRYGPRGIFALIVVVATGAPAGAAVAQGTSQAPGALTLPNSGESLESEELRDLRIAEETLFGDRRPLVDAGATPWGVLGTPPISLTSDTPPRGRAPSASASPDLAWLSGLSLPDIPIRWDDQVVRYLEFYKDNPRGHALMAAWLRRERRWGPMVRGRLRALSLPEDLSYLAMIESGFDPAARSRASAVGMWQFVRATGEEYGLAVDHWVDERRDPEESTDAGARYLDHLYRRFGSWELAFAAYNMGYGALLRSMRKYNTNDYWVLTQFEAGLPFETTFYVAKVMACAIVGRNPERFGFEDIEGEPVAFDRVDVPGGATVPQVARAAGVDTALVAELNPSFRRNRVPPGDRRSVRIPAGTSDRFARAWTRTRPRDPAHRPYVVRFGETLGGVATRFRTSSSALRETNELGDDQRVGAGFRLMVPAVAERTTRTDERPVIAVPDDLTAPEGRRRVFYRTTGAETATEVARFFRVSADELRRWNHVDGRATLPRGLVLQVFAPPEVDLGRAVVIAEDDVRVMTVGSEEFFDYHEANRGRVRFRYTVRSGDTLTAIGRRFELSVGSIARINRFARDTNLQAGQQIIVYTARERAPAAAVRAFDGRLAAQAAARGEALPREDAEDAEDAEDGEDPTEEAANSADATVPRAEAAAPEETERGGDAESADPAAEGSPEADAAEPPQPPAAGSAGPAAAEEPGTG
ncbi:MAG: transglycosylase SLT domain-containing protein [Deltaproteobacteria bacterium]|nr:transglycosylase SLT domain-containing protein [Deltaproteobacteria bacterium]